MKTFAIYNHKGGVGKTSLTGAIGTELVIRDNKVLMIDSDIQGNLTNQFCSSQVFNYELSDYLYNNATVENVISKTDYDNLFIIPTKNLSSGGKLQDWANNENNKIENRDTINNLIDDLKELDFDFVLFDMPPSYNEFDKKILLACDEVLPVLQIAQTSIDGLNDFFPLLRKLKGRSEKPILNKIIWNMYEPHKNVQKALLPIIEELSGSINNYFIPREENFKKAELKKSALQEFNLKANTQDALTKITNDLLKE